MGNVDEDAAVAEYIRLILLKAMELGGHLIICKKSKMGLES